MTDENETNQENIEVEATTQAEEKPKSKILLMIGGVATDEEIEEGTTWKEFKEKKGINARVYLGSSELTDNYVLKPNDVIVSSRKSKNGY